MRNRCFTVMVYIVLHVSIVLTSCVHNIMITHVIMMLPMLTYQHVVRLSTNRFEHHTCDDVLLVEES